MSNYNETALNTASLSQIQAQTSHPSSPNLFSDGHFTFRNSSNLRHITIYTYTHINMYIHNVEYRHMCTHYKPTLTPSHIPSLTPPHASLGGSYESG